MRNFGKISVMLLAAVALSGCGSPAPQANQPPKKIILSDAGWDSIKIHNEIVKIIAEKAYGLTVETMSGSTPITHTALVRGDIDVNMETWTSNINTYQDEIKSGAIVELSVNFDDNRQGVYVPRYVIEGDPGRGIAPLAPELKTIEDLKKYPHVFRDEENPAKGRLYGSIPGWMADEILYKKFLYYKLNETFTYFRPGSEPTMYAAFVSAYDKGRPIAGYLWEPTWVTGKYDLVLLEDAHYKDAESFAAGKTAFPSVPVTVAANKRFAAAQPEFTAFLRKYKTSSAYVAQALAYMQDNKASHADVALYMLKTHPDMLSAWLPDDKAKIIKDFVSR
jgi:ABC-type proline/glycine betaine transport system substrate-binding protein